MFYGPVPTCLMYLECAFSVSWSSKPSTTSRAAAESFTKLCRLCNADKANRSSLTSRYLGVCSIHTCDSWCSFATRKKNAPRSSHKEQRRNRSSAHCTISKKVYRSITVPPIYWSSGQKGILGDPGADRGTEGKRGGRINDDGGGGTEVKKAYFRGVAVSATGCARRRLRHWPSGVMDAVPVAVCWKQQVRLFLGYGGAWRVVRRSKGAERTVHEVGHWTIKRTVHEGRTLDDQTNRTWGTTLDDRTNRTWGRTLNDRTNRTWGSTLDDQTKQRQPFVSQVQCIYAMRAV